MQEYAYLVPIIIIIWVMLVAIRVGAYLDAKAKANDIKPAVEKSCPPHKWLWEEQVGMEGTFFIRCQRCRRLPGWEREEV